MEHSYQLNATKCIKLNGLLPPLKDPENKQYFTPDKKMAKVFGADKIKGFGMTKFLSPHLSDLDV